MIRMSGVVLAVLVLSVSSSAQVSPYGGSTPAGNPAILDSGGQLPYVGNATFKLVLQNHSNLLRRRDDPRARALVHPGRRRRSCSST